MKKFFTLCLSLFFLNTGLAQINLEENTSVNPIVDARNSGLALADIDGDGDLDLMVTGRDPNNLKSTLYKNDGTGNFTEVNGTPFPDVEFGAVGFADVDDDGDQDLLFTGRNNVPEAFTHLYTNDGNGNFTLVANTPFEPILEADFAFEDVDNDDDLDVLMVGTRYNAINNPLGHAALYLNDGSGVFTEATGTPFEEVQGSSMAFIDIENDDDLDVVIAGVNNMAQRTTKLYTNDGAGNFSLVANTPFENFDLGDIAVADSDNDGDQDILISGATGNSVNISKLYINDGSGSFTELAGTSFPKTLLSTSDFVDFDNDGDADILVTGSIVGAEFTSNIYENQGANNFILVDSLVDVYAASIAIGDIDGDNDLDLIIAGISNEAQPFKTKIYSNLSVITTTENISTAKNLNTYLFPNPSNGSVTFKSTQSNPSSIQIFNTLGQIVYSNNNLDDGSQIQLSQTNGLYIVVMETDGAITKQILILESD